MPTQSVTRPKWNLAAGGAVLEAMRALGGPVLVERSAKLIGRNLREGRFLASVPKSALYPGPARQLERICSGLRAPQSGYRVLKPNLSAATNVHFGYESEDGADLYKCYLEFPPDNEPEKDLVFLALKWASRNEGASAHYAITRYWSRAALSPAQKTRMIESFLPSGAVKEAACRLLDIASHASADGVGTLLEVEEPGNPRRSFDINLADAKKTLNELADLLGPVFDDAAAGAMLDALLSREGSAQMGHFAAGTARSGVPFVTLYFGAEFDQ